MIHVVAEVIEDISALLDEIVEIDGVPPAAAAARDEGSGRHAGWAGGSGPAAARAGQRARG